ncbi:semaphorin-5A-like [Ylistrum balloti]|uniref:semaphorin-5A-like n=1 Tax=Ylistrum balloti TaxID=509963 RepID=UPI0029058F8E|nr:semaphorin-5A-like [Ylistrum balloti]XP_060071883.1 semaphorin-5A-like [Ylistrum balloti]
MCEVGHFGPTLSSLLVLVILCISWSNSTHHHVQSFPREFDFRYTTYGELSNLQQVFHIFRNDDLEGYVQLTVDIPRDQLLVGARGVLFRMSLDNLTVIQTVEWRSTEETRMLCNNKGVDPSECYNFIRVLLVHEDQVISCGTNSYKPICTWRQPEDLSNITQQEGGIGFCPLNPNENSTALMTTDGNFYSSTPVDITGRESLIYRIYGDRSQLRTLANSKWLNEPDFISSYEIGDFVYFFFREVAVEYINCGKRIYSRVARICKTDRGGNVVLEDKFTTYHKARMNCSLSGDYPFYFDEIQATHLLTTPNGDKFLYAIFTTPMNSIAGSAICTFNMSAFHTALTGPYKYQQNDRSVWEPYENIHPLIECPSDETTNKRTADDSLLNKAEQQIMNAQEFQMMDLAVQPTSIQPALVGQNERWTHVVVDYVEGKHHSYRIMFLATDTGSIRKITTIPDIKDTCLLEEIKVVPNGDHKPVKTLQIDKRVGAIFVVTHGTLIRIPLHRCERFTSRDLCLNAMDPYCGWNQAIDQCTTAPDGMPSLHYWEQAMTSCPVIEHPVDGSWSVWSSWSSCQQMVNDPAAGRCLCRTRSCDNPKPLYGGSDCPGQNVEVVNCTMHGQWTDWTEWSVCSITCGFNGTRTRQRYCSNPPPKYGGNLCMGHTTDEGYCPGNPSCPEPPVDGGWAPWTEWSDCSAKCSGGIQLRRRACSSPRPQRGGFPCEGNINETRMCNTYVCDEIQRVTPWSPWFRINSTQTGAFEERFQFTCIANVPDIKQIKASYAKTHMRYCDYNSGDCYRPDDIRNLTQHGGWSPWSTFTKCTTYCGGGTQQRHRSCDSPQPFGFGKDCIGEGLETRTCNTHSCEGEWSCWSEYSACSVSCGRGTRVKVRKCQSAVPGTTYTLPCPGTHENVVLCYMDPCNDTYGWDEWSQWTPCSSDGIRFRHRSCRVIYPKPDQCQGERVDTMGCLNNDHEVKVQSVIDRSSKTGPTYKFFHLIVVGSAAFLFGIMCTVGLYLCVKSCRSFRKLDLEKERRKNESKNSKSRKSSFASQLSLDFLTVNNKIYDCSTLPLPKERYMKRDNSFKKTSSHTMLRTDFTNFDM